MGIVSSSKLTLKIIYFNQKLCQPHLAFAGTQHLEGQNLLAFNIPGNRFSIQNTGLNVRTHGFGNASNDVWVLTGVVLRVTTVDVDLTIFQDVDLKVMREYLFDILFYHYVQILIKSTISNIFSKIDFELESTKIKRFNRIS